jgi:hypothetical protein
MTAEPRRRLAEGIATMNKEQTKNKGDRHRKNKGDRHRVGLEIRPLSSILARCLSPIFFNLMISRLLLCVSLLTLPICRGNPDEAAKPTFTHLVSWGPWNGGFQDIDDPILFLDGNSLGRTNKSLALLESLAVGPQDKIKIEIPGATNLHNGRRYTPVYEPGYFIGAWLKKGVTLHFYQGGTEYKFHTLTWSKYLDDKGAWKDDLSTAHLVFDHNDIGQVDTALDKLRQMTWEKNRILLVVFPYNDAPYLAQAQPVDLIKAAEQLADKYGFPEEIIITRKEPKKGDKEAETRALQIRGLR